MNEQARKLYDQAQANYPAWLFSEHIYEEDAFWTEALRLSNQQK